MGEPEPSVPGRMAVERSIGVLVMGAVLRSPPEYAFLCRGLGDESQDELNGATRLVATMGEVPVIPGGHEEHAYIVKRNTNQQVGPAEVQEKCRHASQVDGYKRDGPYQRNSIAVLQRDEAESQIFTSLRPSALKPVRERKNIGSLSLWRALEPSAKSRV